jgi:hypothetical protein
MIITERIQQCVQRLPASFQEVLDFVEYLLAKAEREAVRQEEKDWSDLSLSFAMRGEDEDTPTYTMFFFSQVIDGSPPTLRIPGSPHGVVSLSSVVSCFAPKGSPDPAAKPLDLAIQGEQNGADRADEPATLNGGTIPHGVLP